jgi:hypothetical protein
MPSDREVATERFYIVAGFGPYANDHDANGTKNTVHKRVSVATVWRDVGLVVELDDRNDGGGESVVNDEIHMLLAESPPVDGIPQFRRASDDVCQTGLHGNSVSGGHGLPEHTIKRKLAARKQGLAPLIGKWLPGLLGKLLRLASTTWALPVLSQS